MSRLGYYLGTFDPIHLGHFRCALESLKFIDKVFFSPHPFNKSSRKHLSLDYRVAMINLAINGNPFMDIYVPQISPDTEKTRYSFIVDFIKKHPLDKVYVIMGSDKLAKDFYLNEDSELLDMPHIINKRDSKTSLNPDQLKRFKEVILMENPSNVSSTRIKELIKQNKSLEGHLQEDVIKYIAENRLYTG